MACNIDGIYEKLKNEIINLDLTPGTKVTEEYLVDRFHVSRTPVRSVILRLEKDGLILVAPKKGTFVSKIDRTNISDSLYIRKAVECTVITNLIDKLTDAELTQLHQILIDQQKIVQMEPSIEKSKLFFHNDNLFHATLFHFADLDGVWKEVHSNQINLNRVRIMANLRTTTQVEKVYEQHLELYEHIKNKELDKALAVFQDHIDGGFEGIDEVIKKYKDYFK